MKDQILRTLKGKHLKNKKIIGFDIETYGKENKFYHGGLYNKEYGYKLFYDKEKLIKFLFILARKHCTLQVVATNLMFDFTGLFYGSKYWNDFELVMKQGKMLMAKYKDPNDHFKLVFIDTMNYAQFGVKTMGEILKIPKLKTPSCIENDELGYARKPKDMKEKRELEIYNRQDCIITYRFMKFLQEGFKSFGGKTRLTTSSTAMDIFRRKHLKKWIFKEDLILGRTKENTIHKFIFDSYSGGRTEVFQRGLVKGNLKVYDINSMYSKSMLQSMPQPDSVKLTHNPKRVLLEFEGVSDVLIEAPELYYPLLPFKKLNKQGEPEKLLFPKGKMRGKYTHVELRKALTLGYKIIKMYKTLYYKRTFKPFKTYIDEIYDKKEEYSQTNNPLKTVTKLLLNGLYGKFAEKKAEDTKIVDPSLLTRQEYEKIKGELQLTMSGLLTSTTKKIVYKAHVIPIWATYTTSYARINLYNYLEKYKGLYCDTDSIFTKKEMPTSSKIGDMKLEYDVKNAILIKPKMYMYDVKGEGYKIRMKGVSGVTREKFIDVIQGKKVSFKKFMKLKEGVRRGITPNTILEVEKLLKLEDEKRIWGQKFNAFELQDSKAITNKVT